MTTEPPIRTITVPGLLAAIASDEPAPGAGAAGAVALALGLACARKALRISAKHHPDGAAIPRLDAPLASASEAALEHGRQDAWHFRAFIEATQLAHGDACETVARAAAIEEAAAAVRSNTERLLALCDDALSRLDVAARYTDPIMAADLTAARALMEAARAIQVADLSSGH